MDFSSHVPSRHVTRRAEILLALVLIGSHILFWTLGSIPEWAKHEFVLSMLGYGAEILFFGTPLVLALVVILSAAVDDLGIGSVLTVGIALVTAYVVGISIYTLVNPPDGGGVFFGHIFSSMAAIPFAVVVLLRRILNRLFARLWLHRREIIPQRD